MVSKSEAFPSKYLQVGDLGGQPAVATIKIAALESLKGFDGKEQSKVVCYFAKHFKPLPLNLTNFDAVAGIAGSDETDDWGGTRIELYPTTTSMNGKTMDCIRVRKPNEPAKIKKPAAPLTNDYNDDLPDFVK